MERDEGVLTLRHVGTDGPPTNGNGTGQFRREHLATRLAGVSIHGTPLASCLGWTLAGAVLVNWSVQLLGSVTVYPWIAVLVMIAGAWGLATAIVCWLPVAGRPALRTWAGVAAWATVAMVLACYLAWSFLQIHASPGYGTDEIAYDQYAAVLASHGIDPYLHSMRPAFGLYHVSPDGFTYHLNGTPVTTLSYPTLAFLFYVPFLLLGWSTQLAVVLNALAWAVAIVLAFLVLPRPFRPLALVLGSIAAYVGYAIGGVTDMLYLPLLMGAAYRWTGFVHGRGWRRYVGPVLLGLAMAVKQTPWLVAPFLLAGIVVEARLVSGWRATARTASAYVAAAAAAFLVPNLPYLAQGPGAWLRGVLTPFSSTVVPAGQGAIGFSLYLRLGGGSIAAYSVLTVAVLLGVLALYVASYPLTRPVTFVLPSVVLFFASRSFGSYLVALLPVMVVAAVTAELGRDGRHHVSQPWRPRLPSGRWRTLTVGAAVVMPAGALAYALGAGSPLDVQVTALRSTGQLATVEQLTVRATNRSGSPVRPHFSVDEGGALTTFWQVAKGPQRLGAGASALYTLRAPNFPAQPSIGGGFQVMAFTTRPASASASVPYVPDTEHVALSPAAVDKVVPVGQTVTVHAQLLNQLNQAIHQAGVPVYLGQVIYDQLGLIYSEAVISGGPPGQTPVTAYTDANGIATFRIVGTQTSQDPVYFEANLVNGLQYYPFGYSSILAVRFGRAS